MDKVRAVLTFAVMTLFALGSHPVVLEAKRWYTPFRFTIPGDSRVDPANV
jgi:hypothetical protein